MKVNLYAFKDQTAEVFQMPFCCHNSKEAIRVFDIRLKDKDSMIGRYPEQFSLYEIGSYDDSTGKVEPIDIHLVIMGSDISRKEQALNDSLQGAE